MASLGEVGRNLEEFVWIEDLQGGRGYYGRVSKAWEEWGGSYDSWRAWGCARGNNGGDTGVEGAEGQASTRVRGGEKIVKHIVNHLPIFADLKNEFIYNNILI